MKKRLLAMLLTAALLLTLVPAAVLADDIASGSADAGTTAAASGTCGDNLTWTLDESGKLTISGTGTMWDFINDADYYDYHECQWSDLKDQITEIWFNEGITQIGTYAFSFCTNLKTVHFADSILTISAFAFFWCTNLENFVLPANLQVLGQEVFANCDSITEVVIPGSVRWLDGGVFYDNDSLERLVIDCNPDQPPASFGYCINSPITYRCLNLKEIQVSPDHPYLASEDGVLYTKDFSTLLAYPAAASRTSYTVNSATETLGEKSFWLAQNLKTLILPVSVTSIETYALNFDLSAVYYAGTEEQWNAITIGENPSLDDAAITFHYKFADVQNSSKYYYEPVLWAVSKGITTGYSDGTFRPDATCTRGNIVTFLWRAMGSPAPTSTENPFTDISENKYYYQAVLWAVEQGITGGYSDGTFRPDKFCTRAQAVTFIWRAAGKPAPTTSQNVFSDVSESKYYYTAVLWANEHGITTGYSNGTFRPDNTCSRGNIVTFLWRDLSGENTQ